MKLFRKKLLLKISQKVTGKHLCKCLFLIKVAELRPATLGSGNFFFPVDFAKIFKDTFFQRTPPVTTSVAVAL